VVDIRKHAEYVGLAKWGYDVLALEIRYTVFWQIHASTTNARMIMLITHFLFSELSNAAKYFRYDEIRVLIFLFLQGPIIQGSEQVLITFSFLMTERAFGGRQSNRMSFSSRIVSIFFL